MSNEKIKNHFVIEGEKDKFTKNVSYQTRYKLSLNNDEILKAAKIASFDMGLDPSLNEITIKQAEGSIYLDIVYKLKEENDIVLFNISTIFKGRYIKSNPSFLKQASLLFLLDNKETIKCNTVVDYKDEERVSSWNESVTLLTDVAFLSKLVLADKIEYRLIGKIGKLCEGEFSKSDVYKIKGFYNGLFDPEFMKDDLLKQIEIDIAEKQKQEEERNIKEEERKKKESESQKVQQASSKSSSSCFVITATMGDPYHPIVDEFRAYRDRKLLTNEFGKAFVSFYYKVGPYAASIISKSEILRKLSFSFFVNPIYKRLKNDRDSNKN